MFVRLVFHTHSYSNVTQVHNYMHKWLHKRLLITHFSVHFRKYPQTKTVIIHFLKKLSNPLNFSIFRWRLCHVVLKTLLEEHSSFCLGNLTRILRNNSIKSWFLFYSWLISCIIVKFIIQKKAKNYSKYMYINLDLQNSFFFIIELRKIERKK